MNMDTPMPLDLSGSELENQRDTNHHQIYQASKSLIVMKQTLLCFHLHQDHKPHPHRNPPNPMELKLTSTHCPCFIKHTIITLLDHTINILFMLPFPLFMFILLGQDSVQLDQCEIYSNKWALGLYRQTSYGKIQHREGKNPMYG